VEPLAEAEIRFEISSGRARFLEADLGRLSTGDGEQAASDPTRQPVVL
jgi:hypothetical protein